MSKTVSPTVEERLLQGLREIEETAGALHDDARWLPARVRQTARYIAEAAHVLEELAAAKEHGLVVTASEDGLDAAWKEAEAALPEYWELHVWSSPTGSEWFTASAVPPPKGGSGNQYTRPRRVSVSGRKMAPVFALHALAERLRR